MISIVNQSSPVPQHLDVSLLRFSPGAVTGTNLGGRFALPAEFDATKYASIFAEEGHEVLVMQQEQPIIGSPFYSQGWSVWKYPGIAKAEDIKSAKAAKADKKKSSKKNKGVPELQDGGEHPLAGQPHKVAMTGGKNYVLMFRPMEVQRQVNALYGHLSREAMVNETIGQSERAEGGLLSHRALTRHGDRDVAADREFEENQFGRSTVVHAEDLPPAQGGGRIGKGIQTVHR